MPFFTIILFFGIALPLALGGLPRLDPYVPLPDGMSYFFPQLQSHLRRALLILLFGSFAVLSLVSRDFMPHMRAQKDFRLLADLGLDFALAALTGGLSVPPVCFL